MGAGQKTREDYEYASGMVRSASSLEREATEEALQVSEDNFRALFENTSDGILLADVATRAFRKANPAMVRMLGYSESELRSMGVADIHPAESLPWILADFEAMTSGDKTLAVNIPCRRKDGAVVYADISATTITMDGRPTSVGFFRDVTERRRAEQDRARLSTAIEQAAEAIVITDTHGTIVYVNPAFEAVTGYSRSEAVGNNPRFLKSGKQDEAFYRAMWATLSAGKTWRGRLVNRRKDGTVFSEDATISPVRDAAGATTSYVAVKRDVTPTLALEAQLLQAQKMEAVGRLAGGVAHDFNNILSVILSYSEMLGGAVDASLRADVEEIRTAAMRAANLTRQLLAFSRRQVLEPKVLDLNLVVGQMEKMLRRLLGADVVLTSQLASGLGSVRADPGKIEQILMNLAVNARDAMPGGGEVTIETANVELDADFAEGRGLQAGPFVMVALSDTGTGMDAATQTRLFEPFFTTKERGKGTGLGLATVFGIVKQSGGHIGVTSEPGSGTTFKVYFPRVAGGVEVRTSERPPPESLRGAETILLVEDDDQVRAVAAGCLRRSGYVVLEAPNGGEALLICEQHAGTIDLLLTDMVLPRMSGPQLAARLGALRPTMKVLFTSGYTDDSVLNQGVLDSGVEYLQKPLTPASLARKVRQVLGDRTVA